MRRKDRPDGDESEDLPEDGGDDGDGVTTAVRPSPRTWTALAGLLGGALLAPLNSSMVAVALAPMIVFLARDLRRPERYDQ